MRLSGIMLYALASRALAAAAAAASPDGTAEPSVLDGILQLPLLAVPAEKESNATNTQRRRASVGVENLLYHGRHKQTTALGVVLEVGTPPQKVILEPDTGSSVLWVPGLQPGQARAGLKSTHFDKDASSSIKNLHKDIMVGYHDEQMFLDIFQDQVSFGGVPLGALDFGIGNASHPVSHVGRDVGILGLLPDPPDYKVSDFIPFKLTEKKKINSEAFSLGLRSKGRGALTFGGYDTSKFSGPLEKLAIQPSTGNHYIVELKSVAVGNGNGNSEVISHKFKADEMKVGLDSGAPVFSLPGPVARELMIKLGATFGQNRLLEVGCPVVDAKATIELKMTNSTTISVPLLDFVVKRSVRGNKCSLAIQIGKDLPAKFWIGGHFLRRSLVLFDHKDRSVYVARGADCGSSLVAINGTMPANVVMGKCRDAPFDYDAAADPAPGIN